MLNELNELSFTCPDQNLSLSLRNLGDIQTTRELQETLEDAVRESLPDGTLETQIKTGFCCILDQSALDFSVIELMLTTEGFRVVTTTPGLSGGDNLELKIEHPSPSNLGRLTIQGTSVLPKLRQLHKIWVQKAI